jgi:hypothetical protein
MIRTWGFGVGTGVGVALALVAIVLSGAQSVDGAAGTNPLGEWIVANLGASVWLFAVVLTLYVFNLYRLWVLLRGPVEHREVVAVNQRLDVCIQLFVGIGVIWAAIGMRSALMSAAGDPTAAHEDTAGNVLTRLVQGGILVALTTMIVGGVGAYLMRLIKAMLVGAALHDYFEEREGVKLREIVAYCAKSAEARVSKRSTLARIEPSFGDSAPPRETVGLSERPA